MQDNEVETLVWEMLGGATITWQVSKKDLKTKVTAENDDEEPLEKEFKTYGEAVTVVCNCLTAAIQFNDEVNKKHEKNKH